MATPIHQIRPERGDFQVALEISLQRIKTAQEELEEQRRKGPEFDTKQHELAVLEAKAAHLEFLKENIVPEQAEDFLDSNPDLREYLQILEQK